MLTLDSLNGRKLGDFHGRDNNFNLIRLVASTAVIWTHAFGAVHRYDLEPVLRTFGVGAGDIAVDVFFVLSGFLVAKSLDGKTLPQFIWARAVRIYPALWASIFLSILVVAFFFTSEPAVQFLTDHGTIAYVLHNATMLPKFGAQLTLPHALLVSGSRFNVPLWTLPNELQMYGLLAVLGFTVGLRPQFVGALVLLGMMSVVLSKLGGTHLLVHLLGMERSRFLYFFFAGVMAYSLRQHIVLSSWIAAALFGAVAAAVLLSHRTEVRQAVLFLALPYLLLWCGLVPGGILRRWNRLGDYSYGLYICGCPIQLALVSTGVAATVGEDFLFSMLIALPIAVASWHLLEKRALKSRLPGFMAFGKTRGCTSATSDTP